MGVAKSLDPAALEMLDIAQAEGHSTAFSRVDVMKPCPIGADGACCKNCGMGPCRLVGKPGEEKTGICGATIDVVAARNFARAVAAGAAAHSDHGRDVAATLLAVGLGEAPSYKVKDEVKLRLVAGYLGVPVEGRSVKDIARDVATKTLLAFGQQSGHITYTERAPKKRQEIWKRYGVTPRAIDREVVETLNRTHVGVDQEPEHILDQAVRAALASGWGGSMLATDLTDILFGTPKPVASMANLGVLSEDEVNIVVHGHEPTLSEMIVEAVNDPELIEYARGKGAKGITLSGICCTANEILIRQGVPTAGNYLHQELAILTGAVEAMVVDVQCVFEALSPLARKFHTKLITTSSKAKIEGAIHMEFDEHHAYELAKDIVRAAVDNFPNRGETHIPKHKTDVIAGFSHEYIRYMLGGRFRASFRPLNDNIINGRILGAAGIVGCNNPRKTQDDATIKVVKSLIANNVLVVVTGCAAIGSGKFGYLQPEMMEAAGDGLREVCETVGIPPVLHLGSCVDNSRILTVLSEVVAEGGLGDDISDLPVVGIAPEWMSEKALEIATYVAASGVYVLMGSESPVKASPGVERIMTEVWEKKYGGKVEFEPDTDAIIQKTLAHLHKKREALGIHETRERVLFDMEKRRELVV